VDTPDKPAISQEWLEEFEAAARRPLELRMRYARFRAFDTMSDYRKWCEENLPSWLGYGRV